jgi:hypothetical protein
MTSFDLLGCVLHISKPVFDMDSATTRLHSHAICRIDVPSQSHILATAPPIWLAVQWVLEFDEAK